MTGGAPRVDRAGGAEGRVHGEPERGPRRAAAHERAVDVEEDERHRSGCAAVTGPYAILIGFLAGILVVFSVEFFEKVVKVDDPVGAVSVHGVCGLFGVLCVGLFASQDVDGFFAELERRWKQARKNGGSDVLA